MITKIYKSNSWGGRMFFHTNYKTNKRKFEAFYVEGFGYIFWLWRNKDIYHDWPSGA